MMRNLICVDYYCMRTSGARIIRLPLPFCVIAFKKNSDATCPACKRGDNPVCRRQLEFCRAQGLDTNTTCAGAPDYKGAVHKRRARRRDDDY